MKKIYGTDEDYEWSKIMTNDELIERANKWLEDSPDHDKRPFYKLIRDLVAALSLESKQGWMGIETLEDKEHCWLYTKDLGVFEGCKIGGGYYVEYAISHLTGESICQDTVGTDEAKLDPLLVWQPNRVPLPQPLTTSPEIVEDK